MLSKNFSLIEATRSSKAVQLHIDNSFPPDKQRNAGIFATKVLQPLRDHIKRAINVSSWYRCPALNKAVGGVYNSGHLEAMSIDFLIDGMDYVETFNTVLVALKDLRIPYDQILCEHNTKTGDRWVHLSFRKTGNRYMHFKLVV